MSRPPRRQPGRDGFHPLGGDVEAHAFHAAACDEPFDEGRFQEDGAVIAAKGGALDVPPAAGTARIAFRGIGNDVAGAAAAQKERRRSVRHQVDAAITDQPEPWREFSPGSTSSDVGNSALDPSKSKVVPSRRNWPSHIWSKVGRCSGASLGVGEQALDERAIREWSPASGISNFLGTPSRPASRRGGARAQPAKPGALQGATLAAPGRRRGSPPRLRWSQLGACVPFMFSYGRKGPQSSASGGQHPRDTARLAEAVDLQHLRPSWRAPGRAAAAQAWRAGAAGVRFGRRAVHRLRRARRDHDDGASVRSRMCAAAMNSRRRQPSHQAVVATSDKLAALDASIVAKGGKRGATGLCWRDQVSGPADFVDPAVRIGTSAAGAVPATPSSRGIPVSSQLLAARFPAHRRAYT